MSLARPRPGKLALAIAIAAASGIARAEDAPTKPATRPIAPLAWLVGGTWTADASKLGPGMKRIETRYRWADNEAYIRFTTHFVSEKGTLKNYDGNLFWNPDRSTLAFWYMDAKNGVMEGPIAVEGDTLEMTFRAADFEGKMADLKVQVVRATNDLYTWKLAEKDGESWKALASLDYRRVAGS